MYVKSILLISVTAVLTACGGGSGGGGGDSGKSNAVADSRAEASAQPSQQASASNREPGCALTTYQQEMLAQLNKVRAAGRSCGGQRFDPAPALRYSCSIQPAARAHSIDMASNNFFSHTGSDGLRVSHRVDSTGYEWSVVGENIAAGFDTVGEVMGGWLDSAGHCRNIMDPRFEVVAVSRIDTSSADYENYWTQVFATPR
ncbi:CAP domain-containing protein [Marinobacter sp. SS21]|uniref:CAP domain-containing protein n=1 Tax=Marinobacter sp. SS21 TaxID=2979460 RepID=UPI00232E3440|nr:CAP domain-containing protein [Marinobacter sp. SS21]MDC0661535.1 CAP domain-containing protein [Marinobacter sp. SS21]